MSQHHFPGTASLIASLDRKLLAILRDGRHLVGTLRCKCERSRRHPILKAYYTVVCVCRSAVPAMPAGASKYVMRLQGLSRAGRTGLGGRRLTPCATLTASHTGIDQFSNIVLENASEQHVVGGLIGEIPLSVSSLVSTRYAAADRLSVLCRRRREPFLAAII